MLMFKKMLLRHMCRKKEKNALYNGALDLSMPCSKSDEMRIRFFATQTAVHTVHCHVNVASGFQSAH